MTAAHYHIHGRGGPLLSSQLTEALRELRVPFLVLVASAGGVPAPGVLAHARLTCTSRCTCEAAHLTKARTSADLPGKSASMPRARHLQIPAYVGDGLGQRPTCFVAGTAATPAKWPFDWRQLCDSVL